MKTVKPSYEILDQLDGRAVLKKLELCGRVCYKSEENITDESAYKFVKFLIERGHESVLEHVSFSVRFIVDRGVSHEIVRHRIASFSQESTRYCNYGKHGEVTFIEPLFFDPESYNGLQWMHLCQYSEDIYLTMLRNGASPQEARSVLPNSLKTEVIMTANLREWRHFMRLRTAKAAHPQMREVTIPLLIDLVGLIPGVFDDLVFDVEAVKNITNRRMEEK